MSAEATRVMNSYRALCWLMLGLGFARPSVADVDGKQAVAQLRAEMPGVQWQVDQLKRLDIRGVGRSDLAVVGYEGKLGVLAVVLSNGTKKLGTRHVLRFEIDPAKQLGVCAKPVLLEVLKFSCDRDEGPVAGCKPNKKAQEIAVIGGDCDALHVFWDVSQSKLDWWRL